MEEEREGFVKNSKVAAFGVVNGILGSIVYEIIIAVIFSITIAAIVNNNNPGASVQQMEELIDSAYNSFPYTILVSCLASLITFVVFAFIVDLKKIIKGALKKKTLKYGLITALCIIGFSIIYNSTVMTVFNLGEGGNANQEGVISLINDNIILGFVTVVLLAPAVEELTYRYCLFGEISKHKKWVGYLVSGIIFMFMHSIASISQTGGLNSEFLKEMIYLPPYLFSGLALCYAYDKTGSVGSSFLAHMLNNLISFLAIVCL